MCADKHILTLHFGLRQLNTEPRHQVSAADLPLVKVNAASLHF